MRSDALLIRKLATLLLLVLISVPVVAQTTFYEAYNRGLELEKQQLWSEARDAFLKAAKMRARPERRAKTYGLNFIRVYDPYAHLAHCEARLGMYREAKEHLEIARKAGVTPAVFLNELEERMRSNALKPAPQQKETARAPLNTEAQTPPKSKEPAKERAAEPAVNPTMTLEPEKKARQEGPPTAAVTETKKVEVTPAAPAVPVAPRIRPFQVAAIFAALVAGSIAYLLLRKKPARPLTRSQNEIPTALSRTQAPIKTDDTPTQAILDLQRPSATPTPTGPDLDALRNAAIPLKEGTARDLGNYALEAILGRGGMGTTYLARRKRDGLGVAIKVPHEHLLDNEEFARRFLREGELGSTLHHPNIIRIFEADQIDGRPHIVMELIEGETLEKKLKRDRKLAVHEALEIARDIALALDYARLKGVVHRDLKPDNIMILKRGGLKVMDYGIARIIGSPGLTSSEAYLGTPSYSAPESTSGKVDQQSDLYSLGIILFRMLTGDTPFRSTNPLEILDMHRKTILPPFPPELEIPGEVYRLVQTLTAKDKSNRYKDAESFLVDLNGVLKKL